MGRFWCDTVDGDAIVASAAAEPSLGESTRRTIGSGVPSARSIATDGFKFYARVIERLFGATCVYGQVVKTWRKDRVTRVERRPVIGTRRHLDDALEHSEDSVKLNTA